ncbi:MAG: Ohr family peroxiredoxin [Acholeplasmataceae bacterium]|nr:Ohr family peroxiredoxin [Acholeplasmataceae bacterium]
MKEMLSRKATTYGGRNGEVRDTTSGLTYKLAKPKQMGGIGLEGTDPEELFSVGYSSCFASSMEYLLQNDKVKYEDLSVQVETKLLMVPNEGFKFALVVKARINGVDQETLDKYILGAKDFCPYSKAFKGNIDIEFI